MNFGQSLIEYLSTQRLLWPLLRSFASIGARMVAHRKGIEQHEFRISLEKKYSDRFNSIFSKGEVLHGPFRGLKYPQSKSIGSALFSKLFGSYESELHDVLEKICTQNYSEIINIGCGEGYYAVGLAMRIPNSKVFAFDMNSEAIQLTREMANANGVGDRVYTQEKCSSDYLREFAFSGKGLIVSDCEGYEKQLFRSALTNLKNCDLLIETHDFLDIRISSDLVDLFSETHTVNVTLSTDDIQKAKRYKFPEADNLSLSDRFFLFQEGRPTLMEWL